MNDNKKKVLTDEELQEVSGGINWGNYLNNFGSAMVVGACGCKFMFDEESCKKATACKWEDGKCVPKGF